MSRDFIVKSWTLCQITRLKYNCKDRRKGRRAKKIRNFESILYVYVFNILKLLIIKHIFYINYFWILAEIDANRVNAKGPDILDYASSSDSDVEPTLITDTVRGIYLDDSDNESLHSPEEDPLK